jgi:organic hydroperoxide reductase OsmC/OhrA
MPASLPHQYRATISHTFAARDWGEAPTDGAPSELVGDVDTSSPEHLVLSSLGNGMMTTFAAFAARDGIALVQWNATVNGTVERTPDGLMFTSIVLGIEMEIGGRIDRVATTLEDAKQYCLVLNSLRVPVVIETQIRTTDGAQIELPCMPPLPRDDEPQPFAS